MPPLSTPFVFPLPSDEILHRRAKLLRAFLDAYPELSSCPIRQISESFLAALPRAYDHLFLQDTLFSLLPDLRVVAAPRMTSCGGKFCAVYRGKQRVRCEIRMGTDFLFRLTKGPFSLNGLRAQTALEAFLIVFEHELCHALSLALTGRFDAHGDAFRTLSFGLFGHTGIRHSLPTRAAEAAADGIVRGARVTFDYQGRTFEGFVSRVGKTVTVMVLDKKGAYQDAQGRRYAKYSVPLRLIQARDS